MWTGAVGMDQHGEVAGVRRSNDHAQAVQPRPVSYRPDLATRIDIAARVELFRRTVDGLTHYYCVPYVLCAESALQAAKDAWPIADGQRLGITRLLTATDRLRRHPEQDPPDGAATHNSSWLAYDPWQATTGAGAAQTGR